MMDREHAYTTWSSLIQSLLEKIGKDFPEAYVPVTEGADRHGALEWTYCRPPSESDPLTRLVSLGLVVAEDEAMSAELEFWFGAQRHDQYSRKLSSAISLYVKDVDVKMIAGRLNTAFEDAERLRESDLAESIPSLLW